jgi:hypothetical protein
MKQLRVIPDNYALFDYYIFSDFDGPCARPDKTPYEVGDVVYIKSTNAIGVVLGCINVEGEELRTDMDGMQSFSNIQPATMKDFDRDGVHFDPHLLSECKGEPVKRWV